MKKVMLSMVLWGVAWAVYANPGFHPSGSSLTLGPASMGNRLLADTNNPATPAFSMSKRKHRWAFGLLSSFGVGFEVGQVDNFIDDLDRLANKLDLDNLSLDDANDIINEFQSILVQMGEVGYFTAGGSAHLPGMPIVLSHAKLQGSLLLDVNISAQARMSVLDSPIVYNPISSAIETNTAMYIKVAQISALTLGYSRKIKETPLGNVFGGVKLKYYSVGLTKRVLSLADTGGDSQEAVQDRINTNLTENTGYGLDIGAMLAAQNYSLGANLMNINAPSFAYNAIGKNCQGLNGAAASDCYTAASYSNEVALREAHVFNAQLRVDGALHTANRHWALMSSLDANAANDPVGNQLQWLVVSGAYMNAGRWIPSVRGGYRANLVGSQLRYLTFGTSLFRIFHLDLAYGLDSVEINGKEFPRGVGFNVGFEIGF